MAEDANVAEGERADVYAEYEPGNYIQLRRFFSSVASFAVSTRVHVRTQCPRMDVFVLTQSHPPADVGLLAHPHLAAFGMPHPDPVVRVDPARGSFV